MHQSLSLRRGRSDAAVVSFNFSEHAYFRHYADLNGRPLLRPYNQSIADAMWNDPQNITWGGTATADVMQFIALPPIHQPGE